MADRLLVDTNVISLVGKYKLGRIQKEPEKSIAEWYASKIEGSILFISFATTAELKQWAVSKIDPKDRERIEQMIRKTLEFSYLIHSNNDITDSWALIRTEATNRGKFPDKNPKSSQINDIWIAATAHASKLALLTYDTDFGWLTDIGIDILSYQGKHE